ncbi:indole-3-glycerol phosphate synthase [Microbacterium endophyticum]|uniref:indole-3-glycerol-phosphate synthase n=1 Tax=Microbacterium endophyticum TaxID=1526412 RepID=A0A7W4V574_9MICO|nr:indole-3-glycerol phosphate synthase TrpC [Microbacterium endophyticum]MBB2977052.1 indole-3-glycerol phosphate synthase [Microbacterium endophyticum]NIK36662.1 indole-3-glycerol phosphate synthase [Microbacterium endophyticum]
MLAELTAGAVEDAQTRERARSFDVVQTEALASLPARDALRALAPADQVKIIAEIKRASPSRGDLASITDPALQARRYEQGGASAISVLTEGRKFKGSLSDLEAVKAAVSLPVLRKDFIATRYQVLEARAAGADLVLLIVAALEQPVLADLHEFVRELGMTALVETHSAEEISRAIDIDAQVIGVNARNLSTFELDRDLFGRLVEKIPTDVVKIAESAVMTPSDVSHYRSAGADVVLVGEALVTGDPVATLRAFRGENA